MNARPPRKPASSKQARTQTRKQNTDHRLHILAHARAHACAHACSTRQRTRYTSTSLTLIPHLPDSVTVLRQNFGARWGPYRLRVSTAGVASSGIRSVAINGVPVTSSGKDGHVFNSTSLVLDFASMPAASAAAAAATDSDISTASDVVNVTITFATASTRATSTGMRALSHAEVSAVSLPVPIVAVAHLASPHLTALFCFTGMLACD